MGDVATGDGKDKRYKKKYSQQLIEYANQNLSEPEKRVYDTLMQELIVNHGIDSAEDMMLLDLVCFDFLRIKRLQSYVKDTGDIQTITTRKGEQFSKVNEASYLINAVQSQFRQNMKELQLTRKERIKRNIVRGDFDITKMIEEGKVVDAEVSETSADAEG